MKSQHFLQNETNIIILQIENQFFEGSTAAHSYWFLGGTLSVCIAASLSFFRYSEHEGSYACFVGTELLKHLYIKNHFVSYLLDSQL